MNLKIQSIFLLTILSVSCGQYGDEDYVQSSKEIEFSVYAPLGTKSGKTYFSIGDSIGIYVAKRTNLNSDIPAVLESTGNQANNAKWIYTEEGWRPASPSDKIVWSSQGEAMDFYAYYPYQQDIDDPNKMLFSIRQDQRNRDDFLCSDLLYAANTLGQNGGTVGLHFAHILSLVEVKVKHNTLPEDAEKTLQTGNIVSTVFLNLNSGELIPVESGKVFFNFSEANIYQAILPPQEIPGGTHFLQYDQDGATFIYTTSGLKLESGCKQKLEITLK